MTNSEFDEETCCSDCFPENDSLSLMRTACIWLLLALLFILLGQFLYVFSDERMARCVAGEPIAHPPVPANLAFEEVQLLTTKISSQLAQLSVNLQ